MSLGPMLLLLLLQCWGHIVICKTCLAFCFRPDRHQCSHAAIGLHAVWFHVMCTFGLRVSFLCSMMTYGRGETCWGCTPRGRRGCSGWVRAYLWAAYSLMTWMTWPTLQKRECLAQPLNTVFIIPFALSHKLLCIMSGVSLLDLLPHRTVNTARLIVSKSL